MTDYLRVMDGVAVEAWASPEGLAPIDCFSADLAASFHPAGAAKLGWTWDGGAFAAPVLPVATAADLVAYAAARRYAVETGGVDVKGVRVATDRDSQSMVANAFAGMQASGVASVKFKATSGWIDLSADQLKAVALAVFAHVQACFVAEDACDAGIHAGPPTITTFADIDAAFAGLAPSA